MALEDKYINPLTDFGFKKLFVTEPNKDLLIDFLNQLLPKRHTVKDLSYAPNEHLPTNSTERKAIFDIFCESVSGERFIVELQKAKQNYFKDRSVYYSTFPIQEQAKKGTWDFNLSAVYTIGILDFVFDEHKDDTNIIHTVQLKDQKNEVFYDKLTFIYIELPKFSKDESGLITRMDKWLYVFKHLAQLQAIPIALQERIFKKLFEVAEIAQFSREERSQYEESLKYYRDLKNVVDTARQEGLEQGIEQGMELKKQEIARKLKKAGAAIELIVQATGLSEEEINKLL